MSVYENFISELLRNNLIKNYVSEKETVREYYNANYRQKGQCSFSKFCSMLWYKWYIIEYKKKVIQFDEKWLTYINQHTAPEEPSKQMSLNNEKCYQTCRLCSRTFSFAKSFENHCNSIMHKARVGYKSKTNNFECFKDLKFEFNDVDGSESGNNVWNKLEFKRFETSYAYGRVINVGEYDIEILEVFELNPRQKEIDIKPRRPSGRILANGQDFKIRFRGKFLNSASFVLPIVVAYKYQSKDEEVKYFLKEFEVEVISEFSYLKSRVPYKKLARRKYPEGGETIISGAVPMEYQSYYSEIYPLRSYDIPTDLKRKLRDLTKKYPNFIERYRFDNNSLYDTFASFLNVNPILSEENYCDLLDTLLSIEENQIQVDMRDYDTMTELDLIGRNTYNLKVPGLCENRPSLMVYDCVYVRSPENLNKKFQGRVTRVFLDSVWLYFNRKFNMVYTKNKKFCIQFGYNRRTIKVQKQALLLTREHDLISYFFPKEHQQCVIETTQEMTYFNPSLNEEQKRAVSNIMMQRNAPYLIFGPPGTGKTVTVVESVLQICKNVPNARILVCAPSNSSTNEVAVRLLEQLETKDLFRLVSQSYAHAKELRTFSGNININADGSFYMPSMADLISYRILLTTLVTAARLVNGGVPDDHFSYVFIDESGYATEPECLIPIAGILSNSRNIGKVVGQVVLAGDPRQLGAIIQSNFVKYCGYEKSMLERLIDTCQIYARDERLPIPYNEKFVTKLVKNYRSHEKILDIPNKLFYHNELIPVGGASSDMFTNWEHLMTPGFPVIFHHIAGEDGRENNSPSFFNIQEIEEVTAYVEKLCGSSVQGTRISQDDIGIITPYRKQAEMLRKVCINRNWESILVGSVEQFQGKEKLIIIISTVRSKNINEFRDIDKKAQLGFVSNAKRFNVALTRAKALLIVVGNGDVLKTDQNWFSFIEHCVNNKSVAGKTFYLNDDQYLEDEVTLDDSFGQLQLNDNIDF